jgi:integrase
MTTDPNRLRFTPERLKKLPPEAGVWRDTEQDGLIARRQSVGGELVYYVRYRTPGASGSGRLRLGRVEQLPLAKARQMALDAVVEAKRGNDPSETRKAVRRAAEDEKAKTITLDAFLDEYLAVQAAEGVQSAPERVTAIRQHLSAFQKRPLQALTRRELVTALDAVKKVYPSAAAKLRASVHHVYEIAFDRGVVDANPMAGRRKRRRSNKAKNVAKAEQEREALSLDALARIWAAAGDSRINRNFAAYVRTMIATGARRAELAAAEIGDLCPATESLPSRLTLQPRTTKNGKAHTLFLPPLVMREIDRVRRYPGETLVFPGRRRGGESAMMTGWSKSLPPLVEAARKLGVQDHIHLHGFRRSFRTGLSRLGVSHIVAELMLNHTQDVLTATYDKHDFAPERAEAADRWCNALEAAIAIVEAGADNRVVDIRRRA